MSAFKEHHDELEHPSSAGRDRAAWRSSTAHQRAGPSASTLLHKHAQPHRPRDGLRMVPRNRLHAKELIQSVMEELRSPRRHPVGAPLPVLSS
jgi:hypothetical protein